MEPKNLRKNILDLNYNKYLQCFNTTIVITFTYIVGFLIAFVTNQFNFTRNLRFYFAFTISAIFLFLTASLLKYFNSKMRSIQHEVMKL